jgi:hypothetical protein
MSKFELDGISMQNTMCDPASSQNEFSVSQFGIPGQVIMKMVAEFMY